MNLNPEHSIITSADQIRDNLAGAGSGSRVSGAGAGKWSG